ncbi:oligoendopeptidase F, partial [Candidatus Bipolaricaulota bacterium]|nr:oligoendopeptidase F [Candidatus Bipolaricaulota bacterium]
MSEEIYKQGRWSLDDLIPSADRPEDIGRDYLDRLEHTLSDLEGRKGTLSEGMPTDDFLNILDIVEEIGSLVRRLGAYGQLWFAEDTGNQDALSFRGRVESILAGAHNRTLFFELWWKGLDDSAAERLISVSGDLAYYLR